MSGLRQAFALGTTVLSVVALLASMSPAFAEPPSTEQAYEMTRPALVVTDRAASTELSALLEPVDAFYAFWATGSGALLDKAISPGFVDHTLPPGRPQGPAGPAAAAKAFLAAVPDLDVQVVQRIVAGDRVVSHLRFSGHFTGVFAGRQGQGQVVDFIATDILRVRGGRITDNWHLEDNLTFLQQVGAVAR
jgi:predicted ester cyclase